MVNFIIKMVIFIISAVIAVFLIPLLKQLSETSKYSLIRVLASEAVKMTEQVATGKGESKFHLASKTLVELLNSHNIKISQIEVDSLIESAVFSMNQQQKKLE